MKTYLDCIPCFINQSLEAARMVTDNEKKHSEVLKEVMNYLGNISLISSPPEISVEIHDIIKKITNSKDPYKKVKDISNEIGKNYFPKLKKIVNESDDQLYMAIKIAIIGNVIDFGSSNRFNVDEMISNLSDKKINNEAYHKFKKTLSNIKNVLYIADNSGEIFFDKILIIELLKYIKDVTYVVRANPIINDVTLDDAKFAGIHKIAKIIEGDFGQKQSPPGLLLKFASKNFIKLFKSSDMVISKGQGNYEALSNVNRDIFFMLVVKCPLVAKDINCDVGKLILKVKK